MPYIVRRNACRGLGGTTTSFSSSLPRRLPPLVLGSLGDDAPPGNTLANPTVSDPTAVWQGKVLSQLEAGVKTLQTAELQKWLQIAATLSIPLAGAIWNLIFKGARASASGV